MIASPSLHPPASGAPRQARPWLRGRPRLWLAVLSAACFVLALWRPGVHWPAPVGTALLVVDITQSMNVADMRAGGQPATRLEHVRTLLRRVVRELPCGHRAGVGVFTERKTIVLMAPVEVCGHHAAIDDVLDSLDWRMAWAADSHLYYGTYSALDEIERRWPGAALAFFTDGHQAPALFPGREPRYARTERSPPGVLFGVGGVQPQPVPRLDADGRVAGYWTAEEAASFAATGAATLSVVDMERMAAGQDVRNAAQRPPGSTSDHLSGRRDAVLQAVGEITGLRVEAAADAARVVSVLRELPASHRATRRLEAHDALVALGVLALLAGLLPARATRSEVQRRVPT